MTLAEAKQPTQGPEEEETTPVEMDRAQTVPLLCRLYALLWNNDGEAMGVLTSLAAPLNIPLEKESDG